MPISFDEWAREKNDPLKVADAFTREKKVRRKPRSPEESAIMQEIISNRVQKARENGELIFSDGKLRFKM